MVFSMLPVVIIHFILFYSGSDNFHIHHYMVGMYMYAISYVNKRFSWITQMLGMGVFIDGTSNNAFDPLYDKNWLLKNKKYLNSIIRCIRDNTYKYYKRCI